MFKLKGLQPETNKKLVLVLTFYSPQLIIISQLLGNLLNFVFVMGVVLLIIKLCCHTLCVMTNMV